MMKIKQVTMWAVATRTGTGGPWHLGFMRVDARSRAGAEELQAETRASPRLDNPRVVLAFPSPRFATQIT